VTNKTKKIFFAFNAGGSDQSLFYRLWKLRDLEGPLSRPPQDDMPEKLKAIAIAVEQHAAQMRRQQAHIDEIKRLCHVRTD